MLFSVLNIHADMKSNAGIPNNCMNRAIAVAFSLSQIVSLRLVIYLVLMGAM